MQFENDSAKQLLELSSHKSYTYDPVDDTSAPIISGISSYEYSVTPSDGSWMKMVKDTLKVSSMTSLGQRRGSVLMSIPSQGYSTELTVIQSNGLDRLNFAHTEGMSGRTLTSAGLQSVSERVETYYCLSTDTAWLILPQSNGSKPPQAYYRWFNYGDEETVTDGLLLATGYYKFLDDRGYFSLKYLSDTSRFVVSLNTLPFQVACDVSDYDDYSYTTSSTDSTLNEPTLSYRVVYNLLPASEMATRFTSAQAVGSTATYYLENYNVIAPIGAVVRISTAYDVQGSMCSYFGYDGSNVLERVDSLELYQGGVLVTDYSIDRNRTLVLPAATATGLVVYQLRGLLADGTVLNIAEFRVRYEDASILGPVTSSSGLVSATNLVTNYSYLSGSWYYDFSRNTPFDNWSATELGFAYNSASKMRYPYQSGEIGRAHV